MRLVTALLAVSLVNICFAQKLSRVTLTANSIPGGTTSSGTVEISDKAVKSPVVVTLACSSPTATLPASVTIAVGQSFVPFSITTLSVATDTTVIITATVGSTAIPVNLTVQAPRVTEFSFNPPQVQGGSKSTGTVKINTAAPVGGIKVKLYSNTPYWGGPNSLVIPAGVTTGSFSVTTIPVVGVTDAGVTAALSGGKIATALNITPARFQTFTIDHASLIGGGSAIGTLTLDGPAPKEGFSIKIANDSSFAKMPPTITIASGQTSATFSITTKLVKGSTTVHIGAGGAGGSVELPLVLLPPITSGLPGHGK